VQRTAAPSIASVSAGRLDGEEIVEVEIDNGLERFTGGAVAQGFRESVEPGGILSLQGEEFGDCIAPALGPAAAGSWRGMPFNILMQGERK
jgi:hypothetical protein